jgi:hypothetical protein
LHLGLRNGGGIGDVLPRLSYKYNDRTLYFLKIIYENVFYIVINLILVNIFFGVIVDSFNELRDQTTKNNEDITNKCFICNMDRFETNKENFEFHRNIDHYMFNYVYIYFYLSNKNSQEFSNIESYVWKQINSKQTKWLPWDESKNESEKK